MTGFAKLKSIGYCNHGRHSSATIDKSADTSCSDKSDRLDYLDGCVRYVRESYHGLHQATKFRLKVCSIASEE